MPVALPVQPLQWSRDPKTAETGLLLRPAPGARPGFNGAAILRPRKHPGKGGKLALTRVGFNGAAILRPRKPTGAGRSSLPSTGFNGAAILRPRKPAILVEDQQRLMLQWSRDPKTAETKNERVNPHHLRRRFNGAAILRPRKREKNLWDKEIV